MSYKNLSEEAREGLSRVYMKNEIVNPIKPTNDFFSWVARNLDLVIYGMMIILGAIGVFGIYFDWLKL